MVDLLEVYAFSQSQTLRELLGCFFHLGLGLFQKFGVLQI